VPLVVKPPTDFPHIYDYAETLGTGAQQTQFVLTPGTTFTQAYVIPLLGSKSITYFFTMAVNAGTVQSFVNANFKDYQLNLNGQLTVPIVPQVNLVAGGQDPFVFQVTLNAEQPGFYEILDGAAGSILQAGQILVPYGAQYGLTFSVGSLAGSTVNATLKTASIALR